MKPFIRVVIVSPLSAPVVAEVEHTLEVMQKLVGGYVECVSILGDPVFGRGIDIWCNEEGKLIGLPQNRLFPNGQDCLCGTFFVAAHEDGETVGLTEDEVTQVVAELERWPMLIDVGYLARLAAGRTA